MKKTLLVVFVGLLGFLAKGQTSGGPDTYGYTWKNSNHTTAPPVYSWVDITNRGTAVDLLADDNVVGPFNVPSGFQFYWYPITQFYIGSNGYISLNGANMASLFPPSIPLPSGGNDWIAPHMADLNFLGANNPAECFYLATNDSIIVSFINVPYWINGAVPYTGSNTFQIILTSNNDYITFNYKSMNAGSTILPIDCLTGIENVTGTIGLSSLIDVAPPSLHTIRYYYPTNVTYSVTDCGVNWNNNELNGGIFIKTGTTPYNFSANVKNFGNQNIGAFTVTDTIYSGFTALSNGSASVYNLVPGEDTIINFSNSFFSQFASTYRFATRTQGVAGDLVQSNNRKVQEIISINTNVAQYTLDYSDGVPDGVGISWQGGNGGIGVYIEPPQYPAKIRGAQFHITANGAVPVGFSAVLYDDDGNFGGPGTMLDSIFVPASSVITGAYNFVTWADTNIVITSGGVYLEWYMGGADIQISRDLTPPISARSFEVLGGTWADYRAKLTEDFLMGISVSTPPYPVANFAIDSSMSPTFNFTDLSSNSPNKWEWDFGVTGATDTVQNPTYTYQYNGVYTVCLKVSNNLASDSICKTVRVLNIGLEENTLDYHPFVYPNPSNSRAFVDMPPNVSPNNLILQFYNLQGQQLGLEYTPNGTRFEFATDKLPTGMYVFEVLVKDENRSLAKGKFSVE